MCYACVTESLHHDLFPAYTMLQVSAPTLPALFFVPIILSAVQVRMPCGHLQRKDNQGPLMGIVKLNPDAQDQCASVTDVLVNVLAL